MNGLRRIGTRVRLYECFILQPCYIVSLLLDPAWSFFAVLARQIGRTHRDTGAISG
jgi:hypothetical protein